MEFKITKINNDNFKKEKPQFPKDFEEFKALILKSNSEKGPIEIAADLFSTIPIGVRALTNIDPTGMAGFLAQILEENKSQREQDNILRALHLFGCVLAELKTRIEEYPKDYLESAAPLLTELYFENSKKSSEPAHIECYRNVWFNGIVRRDRRMDEKIRMFRLASSLSQDEIVVSRVFHESQGEDKFNDRKGINIDYIAMRLKFEKSYAQQLCISLQAKGLLHDYGIGKFDYEGPVDFVMSDYLNLLAKYLEDPHNGNKPNPIRNVNGNI